MRSSRHVPFLRTLSRSSAVVLFGGLLAACSNDMSRIDDMITTGSVVSDNQRSVIKKNSQKPQAYPVQNEAQPVQPSSYDDGIRVSRPEPLAPVVNSSPLPSASGIRVSKPRKVTPAVPALDDGPRYEPPVAQAKVEEPVVKTVEAPRTSRPIVLAPRNEGESKLKIVGTDRLSTGSVAREAPKSVTPTAPGKPKAVGWTGAGGSTITVKQGETLYNLSRRFGVPVTAIMKANGFTSADDLTAGKKIQIPAYTYNKMAKVSAPDNDPMTNASRATTGFKGEVRNGKVAVPNKRQTVKIITPQKSVVAATGGSYTVASGDTLYAIARRHGVSISALRAANGLSGNSIRLGQTLAIPSGGAKIIDVKRVAKNAPAKSANVEPTTTGSVRDSDATERAASTKKRAIAPVTVAPKTVTIAKRSSEKVKTPSQTKSGSFRWPTNGRVIAKFGERVNGTSNDGIDISVPVGTPVKATENGTVIYSGSELADFGNLILVSHQGGWVSAYAHASVNKVKRGDTVKRGQVIAMSGKTGNATRPKLHFELRKDSTPVNPLKHLAR